jgi:hypothetical protein
MAVTVKRIRLWRSEVANEPGALARTSLALAGITSAAVQGRSALGPRAGARVLQLGRVSGAPWVTTTGAHQAHPDGFDLHANVAVAANNRDGLEQLARYVHKGGIRPDLLLSASTVSRPDLLLSASTTPPVAP